jgi:5'-nucleotidase
MILVTNDDGIDSEGLLALKQAMEQIDAVVVIAPNRNWTAAGHTKTLDRPLRVVSVKLADGSEAFSSDGTPSDCVALGMLGIAKEKPRLVVSGINKGPNLADDITYSGTVAAAMESVVWGIPSIAVSLADFYQWEFAYAAEFAAHLAGQVESSGLSGPILLNVNVPAVPRAEIKGVEVTRLGKRIYRDELIKRKDPLGRDYYWIGGEVPSGVEEVGSDIWAVTHNYVSITPILMDLTNHELIEQVRAWQLQA